MIDAFSSLLVDRVANPCQAIVHHQIRDPAPDITMLVVDKVLDGDETEASGAIPLPGQNDKMCPSRLQRPYLEELTRCDGWTRILRIAEHAKVKPNAGRHPGRVGADL
jgi:hypothetical protein